MTAGALTALALLLATGLAQAAQLGPQERLSRPGDFSVASAEVAGDARAGRYLAVWVATSDAGNSEVFARAVEDSGRPSGPIRQVSEMSPPGEPHYGVAEPAVAYNARRDEFAVVWTGTGEDEARRPCDTPDDQYTVPGAFPPCFESDAELYLRRLDRAGRPLAAQRRITETGPRDCVSCEALTPRIAHNPHLGGYLVAFAAYESGDRPELQVQRLTDRATQVDRRERAVPAPRQISFGMGDLVYDRADREYVTVHSAGAEIQDADVYLNRLDALGRPLGRRNRVISEGEASRDTAARLALAPGDGGALVAWDAHVPGQAEQRPAVRALQDNGAPAGPIVELPGRNFNAQPVPAWDAAARRFVVAWSRQAGDDLEIHASFVSFGDVPDPSRAVRVSRMGPDPGEQARDYVDFAYEPALVPRRGGGVLATWHGHDSRDGGDNAYARSVQRD